MREPRAISRSADTRVPLGLLTLAFALTVLSISWFGWLTFSLVGALFVVACSFAVWLFAVRSLRSWHADRDTAILDRLEAVKSLRELNEELETRVGQRTAELQSVNHELRVRNELFDQLAENITDVFWVRSPDSRELRYISPAFERIWGRSVASLHANPEAWSSFILEEDRERVQGEFARLSSDVPSLDISYRIVRPDGEIRWVHLRAFQVRGASGELINLTGIVTDITARKRAEATRDHLAAIVESATDLVSFSDPSGRLLYLNHAGRDLLGVDRGEDITRMTIADFLPDPARHPTATEGLPSAIRDGTWSGEVKLLHRSGQEIITSQVMLTHKGADGQLEYISTITRDLTDRKRLEARLFQSQKMETIGKLAGGVAHEFNSILTAIVGHNELLVAGLPMGSSLVQNATEITEAATRAGELTRKLLAYGRQQNLKLQRLDVNQIIGRMEPALHLLMGNGVDMRLVLDPCLHAARVDAGQLEEVIFNLATNAADALPGGGTFTLETSNVASDDENARLDPQSPPGDFVMIAMTDSGVGVSPEVRARMFEPFFTTKAVGQGTGLGLSTCYGIVRQSGGHIVVDSVPGQGTTVRVYLPRDNKLLDEQPRPLVLPSGTETILFVEADRGLREMAAGLLSRLGYSVLAAATAGEALVLIERSGRAPIDLLLTEAASPGSNGNDVASHVHAAHPEIRILFTSAGPEDDDHPYGSIEGAALLRKPFTPSALAHKVREHLDRAQPSVLASGCLS